MKTAWTTATNNFFITKLFYLWHEISSKYLFVMERLSFVVLLTVFYSVLSHINFKTNSLVPYAINEILTEHFTKNSWRIDLVQYGNRSVRSEKIIDKILQTKDDSTVFKVSKKEAKISNRLSDPTILIFDSPETFKLASRNINWQSANVGYARHAHIVYVPNVTGSDIVRNIQRGFSIDKVGFLMRETEKSIDLVTSFMYTQFKCRTNQLVTINRFNKATGWENQNFYPDKYQNLHSCRIKVFGSLNWAQDMTTRTIPFQIIMDFTDKVNGDIQIVQFSPENLENSEVDLIAAKQESNRSYLISFPFIYDKLVFYIPPGEPYTALEKMFLPFQVEFWIAIAVTLSLGFAAIQVINLTPIKVQRFVYGREIKTPTMNLISIFLNGGQFKTPGRNFSRFVLMLFVLWSLIVRTCYQSELFKFIQADLRKSVPDTIDELFTNNFSLYESIYTQRSLTSLFEKYPKMWVSLFSLQIINFRS